MQNAVQNAKCSANANAKCKMQIAVELVPFAKGEVNEVNRGIRQKNPLATSGPLPFNKGRKI